MLSKIVFVCVLFVYNVKSQECSTLPSNLPAPIKNLLLGTPPVVSNLQIPCGIPSIINTCGCPDANCGCAVLQAPTVPPCGCYNPAIGLQNPIIGVQSCACPNPFGCTCGTPAVGNLCGRSTPTIGLATTCGCSDPGVRIVDGCPRCQPIYSYNLPSIGCPTCGAVGLQACGCGCGCGNVGLPSYGCGCGLPSCGCSPVGLPYSCGVPSYLPPIVPAYGCPCGCGSISIPYNLPCGCNGACGCAALSCGCNGPCGCSPVNSCGCVEVPCGLPKVKTTCTCVTPTVETPCGCIQGKPTCSCSTTLEVPTCGLPVLPPFPPVIGCPRYLRQVVVQPPYL